MSYDSFRDGMKAQNAVQNAVRPLESRIREFEAREAKLRALHSAHDDVSVVHLGLCWVDGQMMPCDTIRILDGTR